MSKEMRFWSWNIRYWPIVIWRNLSGWWVDRKVVRYGKIRGTMNVVKMLAKHDPMIINRIIALERKVEKWK